MELSLFFKLLQKLYQFAYIKNSRKTSLYYSSLSYSTIGKFNSPIAIRLFFRPSCKQRGNIRLFNGKSTVSDITLL